MISSSRRSLTPNATIALQVIGRAAIVAVSGSLVVLVALSPAKSRSQGRRLGVAEPNAPGFALRHLSRFKLELVHHARVSV